MSSRKIPSSPHRDRSQSIERWCQQACTTRKTSEFGTAGSYWEAIGWKIDVSFRELNNRIHPKSHIGELRGLLPEKYSPLRANGDGLQSVYLAEVGRPFAAALFRLIGGEANKVADVAKEVDRAEQLSPSREPDLEKWEDRVEVDIRQDPKIPDTQRNEFSIATRTTAAPCVSWWMRSNSSR